MKTTAHRATKKERAAPPPVEHSITHAALAEYLSNGAVCELVVAQFERGTYRIEATLSWKGGRSVLTAARGAQRTFRSLDTLARFLVSIGIGATVVRLELNP